jgi:hypothetical protein
LKQRKTFKQAEDVPPAAVIQYLKPELLARILVYHKHVLTLPCSFHEVIAPKQMQKGYTGSPIQIPATKCTAKSTNHKGNVIDVLRQIYSKPVSSADIGINAESLTERSAKIHNAVTELSPNIASSECASKAIAMVQERRKAELTLQKEMTLSGHLTQIIDTFPEKSCSISDEIDLLEGSHAHRGAAMRNLKFKPFWLTAEETEWLGL